jgi:hypothetical protein
MNRGPPEFQRANKTAESKGIDRSGSRFKHRIAFPEEVIFDDFVEERTCERLILLMKAV